MTRSERGYDRGILHVLPRRAARLATARIRCSSPRWALGAVIGVQFMPHLDEGSLSVRAPPCHTRFRSRKRQARAADPELLLGFPQVTTVANELGRDDEGTDPIGFFNDEDSSA